MADMIGLVKQISDITQCSICLESFQDPKTLPCIHTFCLQCLKSLCNDIQLEKEVPCPICRKPFLIPAGGVEDLITNFFMIQLLQVNKLELSATNKIGKMTMCELCFELGAETEATSFCLECNQHFCDQCSLVHRKLKMSKTHEIVLAKDTPEIKDRIKRVVSYCDLHPKEELKLFCNDCKIVTCFTCYVENHNRHECTDIHKSAEKFSQHLNDDIEKIVKCISECRSTLNELEENKRSQIETITSTEKEISKAYDQLIALIKNHRSELMSRLNSFKEKTLKEREMRKDEIERNIVIMESYTRYCQEMKGKGTAYDISRAANDLHARAEELLKSHEQQLDVKLVDVELAFTPLHDTMENVKNFVGQLVISGDNTLTNNEESFDFTTKKCNDDSGALSTSASDVYKSKLHKVIATTGSIHGVTVLRNQLYVIQERPESIVGSVDVYCTKTFTFLYNSEIHGSTNFQAIASCPHNNCLYLSDTIQKCIYRYDVSKKFIEFLEVSEASWGLAVTKEKRNLLVTLHVAREIDKYSSDGKLLRKISLDSSIQCLHHCVHLARDQYVVSYGGIGATQCGVAIIDSTGRINKSYGERPGPGYGQMGRPCRMSVDVSNNVLVVDIINNRIELLSPTLTHLGYLPISVENQSHTQTLHLDEPSKSLYTGQGSTICCYALF